MYGVAGINLLIREYPIKPCWFFVTQMVESDQIETWLRRWKSRSYSYILILTNLMPRTTLLSASPLVSNDNILCVAIYRLAPHGPDYIHIFHNILASYIVILVVLHKGAGITFNARLFLRDMTTSRWGKLNTFVKNKRTKSWRKCDCKFMISTPENI